MMPMIDVINLQRKIPLDSYELRGFAAKIPEAVTEADGRRFSIAFIGDSRMKQLNEMFRGKETTTDVLSFPHVPDEFDPDIDNLGDIVISVEQAEKQGA